VSVAALSTFAFSDFRLKQQFINISNECRQSIAVSQAASSHLMSVHAWVITLLILPALVIAPTQLRTDVERAQ
jgi:hypothetical protein